MSRFGFRSLLFMLLIAFLVWPSIFDICNARRGRHWRNRRPLTSSLYKKKGKSYHWSNHHNGGKPKAKAPERKAPPSQAPPIVSFPPPPTQKGSGTKIPAVFNVLDFGAQGDGTTDDTKAFETAWAAACKVEASTIVVPSSYQFLVGPVSFSGPNCQENIVFQLDGRIIAPISAKAWESAPMWWIEFTKLSGITVQGNGSMDGSGSVWWQDSAPYGTPVDDETQLIVPLNETMQQAPSKRERSQLSKNMPSIKPTALRFYGSFNVTVTGITIQNSPQCHLKFDTCTGVTVYQMNISSPGDSPNTDGIHLQNSRDVNIHSTNLSCGDDCVSIQTGCSNIYVHSLNCGPGHGISIGSLGRDNTRACVSNVTVRDITMQNTMTGVRIKTWQGGSGSVQGVLFSNIHVSEVQLPIVIDQFYCDRSTCKNQTSAVALSGITYERIRGTYTVKPVHFACSDNLPCSNVILTGIQLQPLQERYKLYDPFCWQAFGELSTPAVPPIDCLQVGKPSNNRLQGSDQDIC